MSFAATILTLFPEMFPGPLRHFARGQGAGRWPLVPRCPRHPRLGHRQAPHRDDTPAGGGPGMVMKPDVLAAAIDAAGSDARPRLLMSPRGERLTQDLVRDLAAGPGASSSAAGSKASMSG